MPNRRHAATDINAAIERRMNTLRQIPARIEAEQLVAKKFAEAGRPLRPDRSEHTMQDDLQSGGVADSETELSAFSPQFRNAFVISAAIVGCLGAAIWLAFG